MSATMAPPFVRSESVSDAHGRYLYDHVVGIPGGPPGETGIVVLKPPPGIAEREVWAETIGSQVYFRSWRKELHFVGSPNFPAGIELGAIVHHTDTGTGTPFEETAFLQCGQDNYERLRCFAYGEPYVSMSERRKIARESERWLNEKQAGALRPTTKTPSEAIAEVTDERQNARIAQLVEAGIAKALADRDAAAAQKKTGKP